MLVRKTDQISTDSVGSVCQLIVQYLCRGRKKAFFIDTIKMQSVN